MEGSWHAGHGRRGLAGCNPGLHPLKAAMGNRIVDRDIMGPDDSTVTVRPRGLRLFTFSPGSTPCLEGALAEGLYRSVRVAQLEGGYRRR